MRLRKFFWREAHANDLANGIVHFSTLSKCRGYEDGREDVSEGMRSHSVSLMNAAMMEANPEAAARSMTLAGMNIEGCRNFVIKDAKREVTLSDAFVVCLSQDHAAEDLLRGRFGPYCVEISDHDRFRHRLRSGLFSHGRWGRLQSAAVIYANRDTMDFEVPQHEHPGFVVPRHLNVEAEFRYLFLPNDPAAAEFIPFKLPMPGIARLCRRIS